MVDCVRVGNLILFWYFQFSHQFFLKEKTTWELRITNIFYRCSFDIILLKLLQDTSGKDSFESGENLSTGLEIEKVFNAITDNSFLFHL